MHNLSELSTVVEGQGKAGLQSRGRTRKAGLHGKAAKDKERQGCSAKEGQQGKARLQYTVRQRKCWWRTNAVLTGSGSFQGTASTVASLRPWTADTAAASILEWFIALPPGCPAIVSACPCPCLHRSCPGPWPCNHGSSRPLLAYLIFPVRRFHRQQPGGP